ncbi:hypothetical protein J5N58_11290 [Rhizobium cremeum]|uniref:hypothetical protein n=1 Tax=Rhizobium cremeum TaxID=2813827 RepID=UPI000DDC9A25|nr:hypothetical protein [Rhizobium cremeum]MCJ7994741.1 hypothetical protein [Rhizobium cremeum]MCJ8000263.1 hypothetical protein [Rhizobium cremeum]
MTFSRTSRLLLAGAAFATLSGPAWALDGQDLLKKINAAYAAGSGAISAESVEVNGSAVTLKGSKFTTTGPQEKSVPLGDLTLKGVSEEDGGAYYIERIDFPAVDFTEEKTRISVKDLYLAGVHVPGSTDGNDLKSMMLYDEAHSGPIDVSVDGKPVFTMAEASATTTVGDDEKSLSFEGGVSGLKADLSVVEDAKSKETIDALNLQNLEGDVSFSGSWELESGTIDIEEYSFDFANIGRLNLAFSLSGYTMDLVKQLQETARTMQGQENNEQAQQAAGLAMLGLMQQMSFVSAEISFEDDGITKRGLDFAGKEQGTTGDQMAQMVKAMVPMMLAQAKLGALQNEVSTAVNTYLDDPQNLTISAAPEKPVPFPMIMGAGMGAPETIPQLLGVSVSANEE